jgi:hypothetical protein
MLMLGTAKGVGVAGVAALLPEGKERTKVRDGGIAPSLE